MSSLVDVVFAHALAAMLVLAAVASLVIAVWDRRLRRRWEPLEVDHGQIVAAREAPAAPALCRGCGRGVR
ncbi:MAG: hypothetical protein QM662_18755 [Gordonia sp. (in: high G+C Gram-positive bacteria)]